jgi:hypothetical protein
MNAAAPSAWIKSGRATVVSGRRSEPAQAIVLSLTSDRWDCVAEAQSADPPCIGDHGQFIAVR